MWFCNKKINIQKKRNGRKVNTDSAGPIKHDKELSSPHKNSWWNRVPRSRICFYFASIEPPFKPYDRVLNKIYCSKVDGKRIQKSLTLAFWFLCPGPTEQARDDSNCSIVAAVGHLRTYVVGSIVLCPCGKSNSSWVETMSCRNIFWGNSHLLSANITMTVEMFKASNWLFILSGTRGQVGG